MSELEEIYKAKEIIDKITDLVDNLPMEPDYVDPFYQYIEIADDELNFRLEELESKEEDL